MTEILTMEIPSEGRYFLLGVPSGIDDEELRSWLQKAINDIGTIREVHWCKPSKNDEIGGIVRLEIDETAAYVLQKRRVLQIKHKKVLFVDRQKLPEVATSKIDDDIVELAKQELLNDSKETWESVVGKIRMTKVRYEEEECYAWELEGTLDELKRFEAKIRSILFKDEADDEGNYFERVEGPKPYSDLAESDKSSSLKDYYDPNDIYGILDTFV